MIVTEVCQFQELVLSKKKFFQIFPRDGGWGRSAVEEDRGKDKYLVNIWPMFFYWVGSQRQFREENEAKMAILSYFDIFVQVSNLSHILPSEYYETKSSGNCLCLY